MSNRLPPSGSRCRPRYCHKDIKPDNILIIKDKYLLADFGISEQIGQINHIDGDTISITEELMGTPQYMSPILKDGFVKKKYFIDHDPYKSDIYSLGLIFL